MISSDSPNPSNPFKLTNRQKYSIPLILAAGSVEEGCRTARIAKQTWYNWMRHEGFKEAVSEHREAVISEALDILKTAVTGAVRGLTGLVDAEEKNIRLRACGEVLDYFMKARELEEMERRLTALEKAVLRNERHLS